MKLLCWSMTAAMALGLLVSIPREVTGQSQPPLSAQQSAELEEAKRLNQQVVQLYGEGKYSQAIPLAERALAITEKVLGAYHPDVATSLNSLAVLYREQGSYEKAEPLYLRSLAIREKVLGAYHPDVANSLNNLALLYNAQGSYEKAEPLYLRSLAIKEKVLGKEHPSVATSLSNLAVLYLEQGSYEKAEPLFVRSLAITEKVLGKEHPSVATSLSNLAALYQKQGSYEKAEPLFVRSLAIFEKVLGAYHPDVATSLSNLAALYQAQGSYEKAEPLFVRSLAIKEKVLGAYHPSVAISLNNLAALYQEQGSYEKAEPLYLRSLAIFEKVLGAYHPDVATSLNNLATLYNAQGSYEKAEPLFVRSLAIKEKVLGAYHPDVATSLNNLAELYHAQGSYEKAESLYLRSLAIREKVLGAYHPDVATSLNNLATLYNAQGSYEKAEPLFVRSLAIKEKVLGAYHPDVATSLNNLAVLYDGQGSYEKAESLYLRSLAIREKVLGAYHPDVAISLNNLAMLYLKQGSYEKAEPLFVQSVAIKEKVLGAYHPSVATSLNNLAALYQKQGSYEKAEPLFVRSLAIREKVLGAYHPDVAESLNNLARLYQEQGSYEKAEPLFLRSLAITEKVLGAYHPSVATSLNNLAELYREQGSYKKAEPLFLRSLAIYEKVLDKKHPDVATSLSNLVSLYWAQGDMIRTTDFLSRELEVEKHNLPLIFAVGSEQRKQNYAKIFTSSTNLAVSLAFQKAAKNPTVSRLALTTVLRRKGLVLDAVADNIQTLRSQLAQKPETKKLLDEWLNVLQQLSTLVYRGQGKLTPEQYQAQFKQLEAEKERLEDAISRLNAEFRTTTQPAELAAIQTKIPLDAALVEIVLYKPFNPKAKSTEKYGKPRYAAAVLRSSGEPKWIDLGDAAAIDKSVTNLREALANKSPLETNQENKNNAIKENDNRESDRSIFKVEPVSDIASVQKLARTLDQQVMAPIRPLLGDARHLLLSPDAQLTLIPFEALQDEQGKYLIQRYAFSYFSSGRDLLRLQLYTGSTSAPVVFANIDYNQQDNAIAAKPKSDNTRSFDHRRSTELANLSVKPLQATTQEAESIKAVFPQTKIISEKLATETAIKQLPTPSILHLATHGFFLPDQEVKLQPNEFDLQQPKILNLENPLLRSGIALAGFNTRSKAVSSNDDGVLTALEMAGLNLRGTQLVVLSACETGLGDVKVGDGLYGLRRALVIAGSQSQLLSLWKVSDGGTKELMVKYYQKLKAGKGRHEALREVQLEFLSNPKYQHPFYWASFVPSGDWTPLSGK
ncbi:tetratricopeptide repeat protein [Nostoc sp. UHCC 0702]|nr:tetratricopeptide repeat protein [Nostoc sp. UHCC 0702]